jgi:hypothetical protein
MTGTELTTSDAGDIDAEIRSLTKLAHLGTPAAERAYEEAQPRLRQLIEAKNRGEKRVAVAGTRQLAAGEGPPADIGAYASLPASSDQFDAIDRQLWIEVLPEFRRLNLSTAQASGLAAILEKQSRKGQQLRADAARDQHAGSRRDTENILRGRYGERWDERRADAERVLKGAMRNDPRAKIGTWQLANGELLGNRPEFISMLIELAEMQR